MFARHIQPSFAGGEVSPSLHARVDSVAYQTWLKEACNFYVHPQGGASNRPGTAFMGSAKYAQKPCRLIPFVVGEDEAYVLEFGDAYIRIFTSAGQVLDDNASPYEIVSPFASGDLQAISYTQYGQKLFLAHPNYPPYALTRVMSGRFSLDKQPIAFGPFQVANSDKNRKMRIVATAQTVQVDGVSASLSLLPVADERYFVYGYFQNEVFSVAHGYGIDIGQIVRDFNTHYNAVGLTAQNLGGVIKITSSQTDGGDWNGAVLRLTYRDSFVHEPSIVIEEALSGGINAGGSLTSGETTYMLESNFDAFSPLDVGGKYSLTHAIEAQNLTGALGYEDVSSSLKSAGDWRVQTGGTWTGTLVVEKSEDLGTTWQAVRYLERTGDEGNLVQVGTLDDTGHIYYIRLRALGITGQAEFEMSSVAFGQESVVIIKQFATARKVAVTLERAYGSTDWTSDWAEGSFSPKNGYPSCVFFYQNRLGLAGTSHEPQTLWFSKTGSHEDFGHARGTLLDSDSISISLSGKKLNSIHSVCSARRLLVFTAGSEWTVSSSGALTPYNIQLEQQSERGSSRVAGVMVGNRALYVQARGGAVRDFYYDYTATAYTGEDLTLCAKHLFHNKTIVEICHQQEPDNVVWCVLSDGMVAALTYVAEQNVCAWTHHQTQGAFRSVCVIPNRGYDEVWFAVARNGGYLVEKLLPRMVSKEPQDQVFLDASVSKKSATTFTEVGGLAHLEGETVRVLADGNPLGEMTVSGGKVQLPNEATCAHVGLAYQAKLQTLPVVGISGNNLLPDQKKRIVSVTMQLADSRGGQIALEGEMGEEIIQRTNEPYNTPLALRTENYMLPLAGSHALGPSLVFTQDDPLPVTLLAVLCRIS